MADYQSLVNAPEYASIIDQLTKRYAQQKALADAQGKGEAQRRGLVNQTGTSDIEMSLRGNKVGAVADAEGGAISSVLREAAQVGNQNQQNQLGREFQTSERLGSQDWQTGENTAQRGWQTGERVAGQDWQSGENKIGRDWENSMAMNDRNWQGSQNKKNSKNWWKDAVGTAVGVGAGSFLGGFCFDPETLILMSDNTKKKIKDIELGDLTFGGNVISIRKAITPDGTRYNYLGVVVTGSHAVKENGKWVRIADSQYAIHIKNSGFVISLVTSKHLINANEVIFADEMETDENLMPQESLKLMNQRLEVENAQKIL